MLLGDAADRKAVGHIAVVLRVGIITGDGQVAGVGARGRASRPPVAARTLNDGSARDSVHVA